MPNQLAVIRVLTEDVVGKHIWNGLKGECTTMPTDAYDAVEEAMAAVLEHVAAAVDWPRLLFEASHRHHTLHMQTVADEDHRAGEGTRWDCDVRGVCGECLRHALLTPETGAHNWEKQPNGALTRNGIDWASVVAASTRHRRSPAHPATDLPEAEAKSA